MSNVSIPQANPRAGYLARRAEIDAAARAVLEGGWYILGKEVAALETEFAACCGAAQAVGVASGTDAVELALRALGVAPGELVFTVSHTATATVTAIDRAGAVPVFVDIDPGSHCMDPGSLERAVRWAKGAGMGRPAAVVLVHLYGRVAQVGAVADICVRHGLRLVEDCAQAHGARPLGSARAVGALADAGAFSFYPTKNLGAYGDGGMVVCQDADLARNVRELREYGWQQRYVSSLRGMNSRLDELQAGMLRVGLRHLEADNARRQRLADIYAEGLDHPEVVLPRPARAGEHVYHQYVVCCRDAARRQALQRHMAEQGVGSAVHYPVPVHLQPAYAGCPQVTGGLPHTERAAATVLSLPMFPQLTEDQAQAVVRAVNGHGAGLVADISAGRAIGPRPAESAQA